jgi:predicted phage tail protein
MSDLNIRGAGGGKSGGGGRVAQEAPDSLRSKQYATVVDLISEGEIGGLVDGLRSVFLDDTPVQGLGTSMNFEGVSYFWSPGAQTLPAGGGGAPGYFPSSGVKSSVSVGVSVTNAIPVVRTISNPEADWIEVTIGVPLLTLQNRENGDISGNAVSLAIDLQVAGGGFATRVTDTIRGKTSSRYQRTYRIPVTGDGPWDVRVRRLSADDIDSSSNSGIVWDLYSVALDVKMSYPNSAALLLSIDAENFKSVPRRGYEIYGMIVRVPVNYDPLTRTYTGAWNGTFKMAWTDNPAWCFYDMVTSPRYGLGKFLSVDQVDKWGLYAIGRYCDELVPDGFGGMEPRFTCNLYLQSREDAFKVVASMAGIFRAMAYWSGGQICVSQDSPREPEAIFTAANAVGGMFTYSGADRRARHTVALVSWNDPADMYRQKIEYVQDDLGIARWGVVETEVLAVGCTSRGQAHRVGKWLLYTELNESEVVVFKAGMDAARVLPGTLISIQDPVRSGKRHGGRIVAATETALTLDAPVEIVEVQGHTVSVVLPSGEIANRVVTNAPGTHTVLTMGAPLDDAPLVGSIWVMTVDNLQLEQWRVINVVEGDLGQVEISAMYYHPGKFAAVENGVALEPVISSGIPVRPAQVTNIVATTELYQVNDGTTSTRIAVSWTAPRTGASYLVNWRREDDNPSSREVTTPGIDINDVAAGTYTIKITPRNALGAAGEAVTFEHEVSSSGVSPDIQNLVLNPGFTGRDMPFKFDAIPGSTSYLIQIRDGITSALLREESSSLPEFVYTYAKNLIDGGPRRSLNVRVKAKTLIGESANWTQATFVNPAPAAPAGVTLEAGPGQVGIFAQRPDDQDLAGMMVWMFPDSTVPTTPQNLVYQGGDNAYMKVALTPAIPVFFRVAFYDAFGTSGLNYSSSFSATPLASGGVQTVSALPLSPDDINGELAVFLNVADPLLRGLHGWSGTEWVNVRVLLDDSVTSDKLAPGSVDFAAMAAGAVQARNLALTKHFIY